MYAWKHHTGQPAEQKMSSLYEYKNNLQISLKYTKVAIKTSSMNTTSNKEIIVWVWGLDKKIKVECLKSTFATERVLGNVPF